MKKARGSKGKRSRSKRCTTMKSRSSMTSKGQKQDMKQKQEQEQEENLAEDKEEKGGVIHVCHHWLLCRDGRVNIFQSDTTIQELGEKLQLLP